MMVVVVGELLMVVVGINNAWIGRKASYLAVDFSIKTSTAILKHNR